MPESNIHPTAIIAEGVEIGHGTKVGAYATIESGVEVGDNCLIYHHAVIGHGTKIGDSNEFFPYSCIGLKTQDLKYQDEPTHLTIGNDNVFREFCTVHRSTSSEGSTAIGSRGNFLAYSHIAHDCVVGNDVIFSNNGTLAGHVEVGDFAVIGGLTAIHQFCKIGAHAITGGCSKIVQDIPPFTIADGNPAVLRGINSVGLKRRNFPDAEIKLLKKAFRELEKPDTNTSQALEAITQLASQNQNPPSLLSLLEFIKTSQRGIISAK